MGQEARVTDQLAIPNWAITGFWTWQRTKTRNAEPTRLRYATLTLSNVTTNGAGVYAVSVTNRTGAG